ncbi:MAG: hypothetical protein U1F87_06225 [Kiritimatiellia bacterium]
MRGNHQTRNVLRLERPVTTRRLTVECLGMNGPCPAAIFEVRCYADEVMRRPTATASGALLSLRACTAEPAVTGEWRVPLDGTWSFTTNATSAAANGEVRSSPGWRPITVPGNWDVLPEYSTHRVKGWYRRTFSVPPEWKGLRIRLRFEAVHHYEATVTLNGRGLGGHTGGYTV